MTGTSYDQQLAAQKNYDNRIAVDDPLRRTKEENWAASTRNQACKRTIKRGTNKYIISLVDKMWICPLKDPYTFFTHVNLVQLLAQPSLASGGLKRIFIVDLLVSLTQLWEQYPHIPEQLNTLEEAQKRSVHAGTPFPDNLLAAISTYSLLKAKYFPGNQLKWDSKLLAEQTLMS